MRHARNVIFVGLALFIIIFSLSDRDARAQCLSDRELAVLIVETSIHNLGRAEKYCSSFDPLGSSRTTQWYEKFMNHYAAEMLANTIAAIRGFEHLYRSQPDIVENGGGEALRQFLAGTEYGADSRIQRMTRRQCRKFSGAFEAFVVADSWPMVRNSLAAVPLALHKQKLLAARVPMCDRARN